MKEQLVTSQQYAGAADLKTARLRCERICKMERPRAVEAIRDILYKMTLYRGQAPDGQYLAFTAQTLLDEILLDRSLGLGYITLPEMEYAVKQAVLHKDIYISVATVFAALEEYATGEGHEIEMQVLEERKKANQALPAPKVAGMIDYYTNKMASNANTR